VRGVQTRHVPNRDGAPYDTPGALSPEQVKKLIPKDILVFNWFWDDNEKGLGEANEISLREWGFEQVYGNLQPHIRDYNRRSMPGAMAGGAPSSWAATTEFNFGKDLMFDFLGCAELLWSTHRPALHELSESIQTMMPGVHRRLSATSLPSDSDPVSSVFRPAEPVTVASGSSATASHESKPIPIGQDVSSIIFVHASAKPAGNRPAYDATWNYADTADLLGWYEVTYDDGFVETVPVRYAVNILEEGWGRSHNPRNVAYEAELVESGKSGHTFFAYEWLNPRFGKPVTQIRLRGTSAAASSRRQAADNGILLQSVSVVSKRDSAGKPNKREFEPKKK
jgi:hypothetical protein